LKYPKKKKTKTIIVIQVIPKEKETNKSCK
jgi:hypothetical protein